MKAIVTVSEFDEVEVWEDITSYSTSSGVLNIYHNEENEEGNTYFQSLVAYAPGSWIKVELVD